MHIGLGCIEPVEDILAFEVTAVWDVVEAREQRRILWPKNGLKLSKLPDVELSFFPFRIRIKARREGTFVRQHFAREPGHHPLSRHPPERGASLNGHQRVEVDQLRIVV